MRNFKNPKHDSSKENCNPSNLNQLKGDTELLNSNKKLRSIDLNMSHEDFECEEIMETSPTASVTPTVKTVGASGSFVKGVHDVPKSQSNFLELDVEEVDTFDEQSWQPIDLDFRDAMVAPNPAQTSGKFIPKMQKHITPTMRAILMDWIMEVSSEFTLKRETFHLAVNLTDRFLDAYRNVGKSEFQLLGLTALMLASKIEEIYPPKIADFAKSADNGYSTAQIMAMERIIMIKLNWKLMYPTVYTKLNWLMTQWDGFLKHYFEEYVQADNRTHDKYYITFKNASQCSYKRFREAMQILDASVLDYNLLQWSENSIVSALLYLVLSKYFYETDYKLLTIRNPPPPECINEYADISAGFGDGTPNPNAESLRDSGEYLEELQSLLSEFFSKALDIKSLDDIYEPVQFLHDFLNFPLVFELPIVCKLKAKERLESHYEDFLAYQTHNEKNLEFVTSRNI